MLDPQPTTQPVRPLRPARRSVDGIPETLWEALRAVAREKERTISAQIREYIKQGLARDQGRRKER